MICLLVLGLPLATGNRLKCYLIPGWNAENMPTIMIGGYEAVTQSTPLTVRLFITWLTSLPLGVEMTVKVGIKVFYPDS